MNRKIWKALGIAVCMLALAAPRAMAARYEVGMGDPFIKFGDAVEAINQSGDTENEIVLMENITLEGNYINYILTNDKTTTTKTTTIKGEGHKISIKSKAEIKVEGEKTVLNLGANGYDKKLTIDGDTTAAFIVVSGGATANMNENVTLQNRMFTGNAYVLVTGSDPVTGSKSVFNMKGGVIEGGSRAVIAQSGATFNMSGGEIRNCNGGSGNGGGAHVYGATFLMSGGTISGCTANEGGGLCAEKSSTVTISGGTISGCKGLLGGGLYADNSAIEISGGVISGCKEIGAGGGLYVVGSTLNIKGGIISECSAVDGGGGLYATNQSTINISGGIINGCEGLLGGGLYANNSTVTITDGTISRCNVGAGGGLYATNSSKITIRGGTISECSTTLDTGKGGGLYAENSTLTISGGRIENNKAARGGGVALTNSTVTDEKPIRNWTVVGNKAYKTGGGIWLGEKVEWDISDRTKQIYNNQAIEQGADIFLEGGTSAIKLPNAANMGAFYHNSNIKIDNWYNDNPRYTPSENGQVVKANKWLNGGLSLVASYKASPVRIEIDANGGKGGSGSQTVQKGTNVTLEAPTKEGHLFKGWKDEKGNSYPAGEDGKVNITVTGDMTLTAEWKKLPSAENLPKTGDESPVLLWGAALAVSAAACFMLRRRK